MAGRHLKAKPISGPVVVEDGIQQKIAGVIAVAGVLVHQVAAKFPMQSDPELDPMAADIKVNGVRDPVEIMRGKDGVLRILDGRNRLRACELIAKAEGRELERTPDGLPKVNHVIIDEEEIPDPLAYVVSRNLHRRHLKDDQRNDVIRSIAEQYPHFSIRRLADVTGASASTVYRAIQKEPVKPELAGGAEIKNPSAGVPDFEDQPEAEVSGVSSGTPAPQPKPEPAPQPKPEEPKRVIGKDGKSYSKNKPAKSKPTGEKPDHSARLCPDDDEAVRAAPDIVASLIQASKHFAGGSQLLNVSGGTLPFSPKEAADLLLWLQDLPAAMRKAMKERKLTLDYGRRGLRQTGSELAKKPRETIEGFIKLMQDARRQVLDIGEPTRMELAMKFALALGFGPDDLSLHLNKDKAASQEKAA
jgi:ParB-like nuclease family protein